MCGLGPDVSNTVETCIAGNSGIGYADGLQELFGIFILDKNMGKISENIAELLSPRAEERLRGPENGRNEICRHIATMEFRKEIAPELIFDKYSGPWVYGFDETACLARSVERQIDHGIDKRIVFADVVA